MITDLTVGSPAKVLFRFSLPLLLSVAFQQLYQMADSIIAGRFAGELALAAVGASYPITMLFIAVATGLNIGASVLVSQLFGAKRFLRMKSAASTALLTTGGIALLLTLVGALLSKPIMRAIQTPDNILADGELYLRVYVFGLLFLFLYNICTGIFNAMGDSRTPLLLLIVSSVVNVGLDLLFVAGFRWGVAGVAWATFVAQGGASVLAFVLLIVRMRGFVTGKSFPLFSLEMLRRLSNFAIPSICQQSFVSVGNLIVQYIINTCGASVIAGFSAANRISMFALTCSMSFASGLSSFVAQNFGAEKLDRVARGRRAGLAFSCGMGAAFALLFLLLSRRIVGLFVDGAVSVDVIEAGRLFLLVTSPFFPIVCIKFVCDSVLRGAGAMRYFMVTTFSDLILRVTFSVVLFLALGHNAIGVYISWPIGWFLGTGLSVAFNCRGRWAVSLRPELRALARGKKQ